MTTNTINTLADIKTWQAKLYERGGTGRTSVHDNLIAACGEISDLRAYAEKLEARIAELEALAASFSREYDALLAECRKDAAAQPPAPAAQERAVVVDGHRMIPDSECAQGKCACPTTGCWDQCNMRRWPELYGGPKSPVTVPVVAAPAGEKAVLSRCDAGVVRDAESYRWIRADADRRWWTLWGFSRNHKDGEQISERQLDAAIAAAQAKEKN